MHHLAGRRVGKNAYRLPRQIALVRQNGKIYTQYT